MSKLQGIFVQYHIHRSKRLSQNFSFWETGFACPATLISQFIHFLVGQGGSFAKSKIAAGRQQQFQIQKDAYKVIGFPAAGTPPGYAKLDPAPGTGQV
jgi:hypothetical protein